MALAEGGSGGEGGQLQGWVVRGFVGVGEAFWHPRKKVFCF